MKKVRIRQSHALLRKNSMSRTGYRMALISTRPLSLPSAGAFPLPVHLKLGELLSMIRIPMGSIAILLISLFESTPSRKRSFKRPRHPWSLVKEWPLEKYDREVAYEEIKRIMGQSLDDAGSKSCNRPNANSIAGWRVKQVSDFLLSILLLMVLIVLLLCRIMRHATKPRRSIRLVVHLLIDAAATCQISNFCVRRRHLAGISG